jgi:hypothetical protein
MRMLPLSHLTGHMLNVKYKNAYKYLITPIMALIIHKGCVLYQNMIKRPSVPILVISAVSERQNPLDSRLLLLLWFAVLFNFSWNRL